MAERITKVRECDRKFCRNRKGVSEFRITVVSTSTQMTLVDERMELCPAHYEMARDFIIKLDHNTKEYDDV